MRRQLLTGLLMTVVLTAALGLLYPLAVFGVSQGLFRHRAEGSLVTASGKVVGSSLLGQNFVGADGQPDARYFQPRPSAAGNDGYDPLGPSSASNLGPSNPALIKAVTERVAAYRQFNHLPSTEAVPADAVTASASGLDPDISVANAELQAPRVALARHIVLADVMAAVAHHTEARQWGVLGEKVVNVLELNLDLDRHR